MFERTELLFGENNMNILFNAKVLVIGVGGVGGYCVESLVRCGIKNIGLIDYDTVDITNKNRQLIALDSTIGMKKIDAFKHRINDINSECFVKCYDVFLNKDNIPHIIQGYDYVIDACDTISTKFEIIKYCKKNNIKFISSMGTGKRVDPLKLTIKDLSKTSYDPLAKKLRKIVRDEKIKGKITVLCSEEEPHKINSKIIGSNSFVPACAGLIITSYVIRDIIGDFSEKNK